jgi:hypothetical protein
VSLIFAYFLPVGAQATVDTLLAFAGQANPALRGAVNRFYPWWLVETG